MENVGMVYLELDDAPRGLQYFEDALSIRMRLKEAKGLGVVLHHLGSAQAMMNEHQQALDSLNQALVFSRECGDKQFEAYELVELGMIHIAERQPSKAPEFYEPAFK